MKRYGSYDYYSQTTGYGSGIGLGSEGENGWECGHGAGESYGEGNGTGDGYGAGNKYGEGYGCGHGEGRGIASGDSSGMGFGSRYDTEGGL